MTFGLAHSSSQRQSPPKMFEFLTDECVSDHNERYRSMQIDKFFSYLDVPIVQLHDHQ